MWLSIYKNVRGAETLYKLRFSCLSQWSLCWCLSQWFPCWCLSPFCLAFWIWAISFQIIQGSQQLVKNNKSKENERWKNSQGSLWDYFVLWISEEEKTILQKYKIIYKKDKRPSKNPYILLFSEVEYFCFLTLIFCVQIYHLMYIILKRIDQQDDPRGKEGVTFRMER